MIIKASKRGRDGISRMAVARPGGGGNPHRFIEYSSPALRRRFAEGIPRELLDDPRTLVLWERAVTWFRREMRRSRPGIGHLLCELWQWGADADWLKENQTILLNALVTTFELENGQPFTCVLERATSSFTGSFPGWFEGSFLYLMRSGRAQELMDSQDFYVNLLHKPSDFPLFTLQHVTEIIGFILETVESTEPIRAQLASIYVYALGARSALLKGDIGLDGCLMAFKRNTGKFASFMCFLLCQGVPVRMEGSLEILGRACQSGNSIYRHFAQIYSNRLPLGDQLAHLLKYPAILTEEQRGVVNKASMVTVRLSRDQFCQAFSPRERSALIKSQAKFFHYTFHRLMTNLMVLNRWKPKFHRNHSREVRQVIQTLLLIYEKRATGRSRATIVFQLLGRPQFNLVLSWVANYYFTL